MRLEAARELKESLVERMPIGLRDDKQAQQEIYYISGPMTGNDGFNYAHFNEIAKCLRGYGFQITNPAENFDGDSTRDRTEYMRLDMQHVLDASDIVLLPRWETSRGARLEAQVALEIGLQMWFLRVNQETTLGVTTIVSCEMLPASIKEVESILFGTWHPNAFQLVPDGSELEVKPVPILEEAARITSKDRQQVYGHPKDDFKKTVAMWNGLFESKLVQPFDERDFCLAMIAVKMSRLQKTPEHRDSLLDIVGYARCYEMVQEVLDGVGG